MLLSLSSACLKTICLLKKTFSASFYWESSNASLPWNPNSLLFASHPSSWRSSPDWISNIVGWLGLEGFLVSKVWSSLPLCLSPFFRQRRPSLFPPLLSLSLLLFPMIVEVVGLSGSVWCECTTHIILYQELAKKALISITLTMTLTSAT